MTTATPTRPEELEDLLSDPARVAALSPDDLKNTVAEYARNLYAKDKGIAAQVREETTKVLAELLEVDRKEAAKLNLAPDKGPVDPHKGAALNKRAPGNAVEDVYDGSADFLRSIWHGAANLHDGEKLQAKAAKARQIQNAFSSLTPGDGGFLIPETLRAELLRVALESAVVRSRARVIPMESSRVPLPSIDSTSNASSVYGGITAYWTEEAATLTSSSATFGRVVLDAKKLTAYADLPNELLADASALGGFFDQNFPEAVAWFEDVAFIGGSGTGEPLGFLNAPAAVTVTKESGQANATILWQNIVKAYARMLPSSLGKAVWIVNQETFPELATMALSVGTGGSAIWLNNGAEGPPATILGRPVVITEKVPALGTAGDVNFVDLSYYLIGDRQLMQAASSPHAKFTSDQTSFRIVSRLDGRPWLGTAITPKQGTNTLSPFVQLGAR